MTEPNLYYVVPQTDPSPRTAGPLYGQDVGGALVVIAASSPTSALAKGADNTGSADAASIINGALTDSDGLTILPPGRFRVSSQKLVVPDNKLLMGFGWKTILVVDSDISAVQLGQGAGLANLQIQSQLDTTQPAVDLSHASGILSNWFLRDVYIQPDPSLSPRKKFDTGVKGVGAISGTVERVLIDNMASYGLHYIASGSSGPNAIDHFRASVANCATAGAFIEDSDGAVNFFGGAMQGGMATGIHYKRAVSNAVVGKTDGVYHELTGGAGTRNLWLENVQGMLVSAGKWASNAETNIDVDGGCREVTLENVFLQGNTNQLRLATGAKGIQAQNLRADKGKITDPDNIINYIGFQDVNASSDQKQHNHLRVNTEIGLPIAAPNDYHLNNQDVTMWVDEGSNTLHFRYRRSDGVIKTGSVTLT